MSYDKSGETMSDQPQLLDVVALTEDVPSEGLRRGQVGTIVEVFSPTEFEVEFSDDQGRAYAVLPLTLSQLLVLRYRPVKAA